MKGTCFGPNWWRGYLVDHIYELLYWHTTYECVPVGCITIFTSHLPTLPPSHSPPHSHHVMSTVTCVLKACVPNGAVAKQPPSTAIKPSLPSCTNRLTTVLVFAKPDPAPHHPIPQAAQITKHLTTGMVAHLVKIPQLEALFYSWLRLLTYAYLVYLAIVPLRLPQVWSCVHQRMLQVPNKLKAKATVGKTTRRSDQHYNHFDPDSHSPHNHIAACKDLSMGGCLHTYSYSERFA